MEELLNEIEFELREYENTCYQRVQREYGKIEGVDFVMQTIRQVLKRETDDVSFFEMKERSQDVDSSQ